MRQASSAPRCNANGERLPAVKLTTFPTSLPASLFLFHSLYNTQCLLIQRAIKDLTFYKYTSSWGLEVGLDGEGGGVLRSSSRVNKHSHV